MVRGKVGWFTEEERLKKFNESLNKPILNERMNAVRTACRAFGRELMNEKEEAQKTGLEEFEECDAEQAMDRVCEFIDVMEITVEGEADIAKEFDEYSEFKGNIHYLEEASACLNEIKGELKCKRK